ncbi:MAG: class I SAM-dependent methyltransferase, partial [Candidatus Brocadiia bacterium]
MVMPNNKEFLRRNFSETILLNLKSNVFLEYCARVYGYKFRLGNMLIKNDLDELLEYIEANKPLHVLDFGCGCGELIRKIATDYNLQCTGVEFSEQVVNYL